MPGVGFPILGMNAFSQVWSAILPLRWYMAVLLGQAARGLPLSGLRAPVRGAGGTGRALRAARASFACARSRHASVRDAPQPATGAARRRAARHRRRLYGRMAARARNARRLQPAGPGAADLRHLLSAALSEPDPAQDPDRGRRQRSERSEPQHRADAGCERRSRAWRFAPTRSPRRAPRSTAARPSPWSASRPAPSATCSRASPLTFRSTPMPPTCSSSGRRRNGIAAAINTLSSELAAGGARTDGSLVKAKLAAVEPGRHPAAADLQPGRRLCELYRAGGLRADPAADAPDRRGDADRRRAGAGGGRSVRERARPRHRPPDHLSAGARALSHRAAAHLRLFDARPPAAIVRARVRLHARDELHGPGGRGLVQASGNADAHLPRHQPAAVLPDRLRLAARSDPQAGAGRRATSSRRISRSTASCASTSWARACGRWRTTGAGCGALRSSISRSP